MPDDPFALQLLTHIIGRSGQSQSAGVERSRRTEVALLHRLAPPLMSDCTAESLASSTKFRAILWQFADLVSLFLLLPGEFPTLLSTTHE